MSESSKVTVNYFCVGALLIFIGCVLICSLGFTIVLPYELTKNWPEVTCRVLNSSFNPHLCSCEEGYGGLEQYHGNGWIYNRMTLNLKSNDDISNISEKRPEGHDSIADRFFHHPTCSSKFPCLQILVEYHFPMKIHDINNNITIDSQISTTKTVSSEDISDTKSNPPRNRTKRSYNDQVIFLYSLNQQNKYLSHKERSRVLKRSLYENPDLPLTTEKEILVGTTFKTPDNSRKPDPLKTGLAYLYRSWDDSFHARCSLIECGDEIWNINENRKFRMEWGVSGKTFTCFYNPNNYTVVIKEKTSPVVVMHAILWPSLSLLIGTIIWICLCFGCCKSNKDSSCKEKYKLVS